MTLYIPSNIVKGAMFHNGLSCFKNDLLSRFKCILHRMMPVGLNLYPCARKQCGSKTLPLLGWSQELWRILYRLIKVPMKI